MSDCQDYTAGFNGEWVYDSEVKIAPEDRGFKVSEAKLHCSAWTSS